MRTLAEYILRGRTQAILVAMVAAAMPILFWLSAATVGLVTLRRGPQAGLLVLLWAGLPAAAWWILRQDPQISIVLLLSYGMALSLRQTVSWNAALWSGVALALLVGWSMPVLLPALLAETAKAMGEVYRTLSPQAVAQLGNEVDVAIRALVMGAFAASHLLVATLSLMLARSWQAQLFNPGGFRQEFHQFRLRPATAVAALVLTLAAPAVTRDALVLAPILMVPMLLAGLALVHGYVAKRRLGGYWLVAFYAVAVLMGPSTLFLLMLVAVLDSWIDFRGRTGIPG